MFSEERPYYPIPEAAARWCLAVGTLYVWRSIGKLPKTVISGKAIVYAQDMERLLTIRKPKVKAAAL